MNKYGDMLKLKRPQSTRHPPMSLAERAGQFSPFAALSGHEEAINETARETAGKIALSEEEKFLLDEKLNIIRQNLTAKVPVSFLYFQKDEFKAGGAYLKKSGIVKKIAETERKIIFEDKSFLCISDILAIESDLFTALNLGFKAF